MAAAYGKSDKRAVVNDGLKNKAKLAFAFSRSS
jgi:hypothetical protein